VLQFKLTYIGQSRDGTPVELSVATPLRQDALEISRVGQNHTFLGIYGVHTVFLAGKSPYIRSYTVQIYGSDQS